MNNYKSVKVIDPVANQQLIRLKPNQCLEICLNEKKFANSCVVFNNNFFELIKKNTSYILKPKDFIFSWAEYSSVFLGSVCLRDDFRSSNIITIVESSNDLKSNFLTVINPNNDPVRMTPGDVLEIILFDYENKELDWTFSGTAGCKIDFLGQSFLNLSEEQSFFCPEYSYAQLPRSEIFENKPLNQKHFWFRFDKKLMNLLSGTCTHPQYFGNLVFNDQDGQIKFSLSLYMVLHKKYKTRVLNSLLLNKLYENNTQPSFGTECDFDDKNLINNVKINLIKNKSLTHGCDLKPIVLQKNSFQVVSRSCIDFDEERF